jgi:hypothetical protein
MEGLISNLKNKQSIALKESKEFLFNKKIEVTLSIIGIDFEEDIYFAAFFVTKEGRNGGVFSKEYRGIKTDVGSRHEFPFMLLLGDSKENEETIQIFNLQEIDSVFLTVINYRACIEDSPLNFNDSKCSINLITDYGDNLEISEINNSEKGMVYQIGRIYHNNGSFILTNDGLVMNLSEAFKKIPGFSLITITSSGNWNF